MDEVEGAVPGSGPPAEPGLRDVLEELRAREPIFHRPELGTTRAHFEAQTAPDYWEVGASGRRYDRETVWATLEGRYADPGYWAGDEWETGDFACRRIAPETYLLTYTLRQGQPGEPTGAPAPGVRGAPGERP